MRKTLGIFFIAALTVVAFVCGSYLLVSDSVAVAYLSSKIESTTDVNISYEGEATLTRSFTPMLTMADLTIENTNKSVQFKTDKLELQANLIKFLRGNLDISNIRLGNTTVNIRESTY